MPTDEPHAEGNEVETRWDGSVPIVYVSGSLVRRTRAHLETELSLACSVHGDVIVDVAQVPEADPHRDARPDGGHRPPVPPAVGT